MIGLLLSIVALSSFNNELPPVKYQGNAIPSVVVVVDNTNTKEACGVAPKGWVIRGCEYPRKGVPIITMPNPCTFPEAIDPMSYAHLLCHEFGHANGWNSDHDN